MPRPRDLMQKMVTGEAEPPPVAMLVGFRLIAFKAGEAVVQLQADGRHANPMGTLHGGIVCDIADAAMGLAYATLLEEGESFTTIDLTLHFLRPVWNATLTATGRVVHRGRTVGLVDCDIRDERDRLIATSRSTCMTLRGTLAEGR
jgi:uncharacterized protein (TIGR00369 family)